jgi:enamine deaminase RidA (YjgF/YER057c/UK114 family)
MTQQQDTLAQLNKAKAQLTQYLIVCGNTPGSPESKEKLQDVAAKESEVEAQIATILATAFQSTEVAKVQAAISDLGVATTKLVSLGTVLTQVNDVLQVVGTIVKIAGTIITLAT